MSLLTPRSTHCSGILPPRARQRWNYSKRDQASHESNAESNSCRPESLPLLWRGELPGIAKAPSPCTPCYLSAPAPAEPNDPLWSTTHPVSLFAPGIACTRKRRSRRVSVRCFLVLGRTQPRVGPSRLRGERGPGLSGGHRALHCIAQTAALRPQPSCCGSPMGIGARTDNGGRYTATPTSSHPTNRRRPDPHRRFQQCLVFDH